MTLLLRPLAALARALPFACALLLLPGAATAEDFRPKAETYICPNVPKQGVDCFLDAVEHLYTMCRQVKSIEVIEFGLEHAEEGVNGAKSEYCVDKHKSSIVRPFQAALREAGGSRAALEALRGLHALWTNALAELKWRPPETTEEYHQRIAGAYDVFRERATLVRTALSEARTAKPAATARAKARAAAQPPSN